MNNENNMPDSSTHNFEFSRAKDFQTIYANFIQGAFTPFDISLLLGGGYPAIIGKPEVELKARIVFSPIEAKMVLRILRGMIASYEKQFGDIKVPESVAPIATTGKAVPIPDNDDDSEGD